MKKYKSVFKEGVFDNIDVSSIDLTPLEKKLSKMLKTNITLTREYSKQNALRVRSQNLTDYTGLFENILTSCFVTTSSVNINERKNELILILELYYTYIRSKSHSIEILKSYYNLETKKWTFEEL